MTRTEYLNGRIITLQEDIDQLDMVIARAQNNIVVSLALRRLRGLLIQTLSMLLEVEV